MAERLPDLLLEAAQWLAKLSHPASIASPEDALDAVRGFMATEARIHALPAAAAELERELRVPLDPSGRRMNHAMMAGMVLARTGWPSTAATLLAAARATDTWCATQARLNLGALAPTPESSLALTTELDAARLGAAGALPDALLADALAQQHDPAALPTLARFLDGEGEVTARASGLISLVEAMPEDGLDLAASRQDHELALLAITATGLRAVYGDDDAYARLLEACRRGGETETHALRWAGRIPRPESLAVLEHGLVHPSGDVRVDVVTALATFGEVHAWELVLAATSDRDADVSQQATNLAISWLADEPDFLDLTRRWEFDASGRLVAKGRRELVAIATRVLAGLTPGVRHERLEPLDLARTLDHLYAGTLPHYLWFQWVACTGVYGPYSTRRTALHNFPTLESLEDWYQLHGAGLVPGGWYYAGRHLTVT